MFVRCENTGSDLRKIAANDFEFENTKKRPPNGRK